MLQVKSIEHLWKPAWKTNLNLGSVFNQNQTFLISMRLSVTWRKWIHCLRLFSLATFDSCWNDEIFHGWRDRGFHPATVSLLQHSHSAVRGVSAQRTYAMTTLVQQRNKTDHGTPALFFLSHHVFCHCRSLSESTRWGRIITTKGKAEKKSSCTEGVTLSRAPRLTRAVKMGRYVKVSTHFKTDCWLFFIVLLMNIQ